MKVRSNKRTGIAALAMVGAVLAAGAGCSNSDSDKGENAGASTSAQAYDLTTSTGPVTVRVGYFANVTHAPAIVGVEKGLFQKELGSDNKLETKVFNAGPEAVEAIFADALDIAYIGPNPAINAFAKSQADGGAIRIIAGAASGGAALVTKPSIASPQDLSGTTLASPQLGGTQDVALRSWLKEKGIAFDTGDSDAVAIQPQQNADTLTAFKAGDIDGAWVPEPWVSRLVLEGGGKVLVDEASLWPKGDFVTAHLIVRTAFLEEHPDVVASILRGHLAALDVIESDAAAAKTVTNEGIKKITGKSLTAETIDAAWKNLRFTVDPVASSLSKSADAATSIGLLDKVDLDGIYDLSIINTLLKARGDSAVSDS